jgi:hypothetical protein
VGMPSEQGTPRAARESGAASGMVSAARPRAMPTVLVALLLPLAACAGAQRHVDDRLLHSAHEGEEEYQGGLSTTLEAAPTEYAAEWATGAYIIGYDSGWLEATENDMHAAGEDQVLGCFSIAAQMLVVRATTSWGWRQAPSRLERGLYLAGRCLDPAATSETGVPKRSVVRTRCTRARRPIPVARSQGIGSAACRHAPRARPRVELELAFGTRAGWLRL